MKQSDIITIVLISTIGMLVAYFAGNAILGDPNMESVTYKVVDPIISSELMEPDPELFNEEAINPTVEVTVGTCEDTNGNGILDPEERNRCLNENNGGAANASNNGNEELEEDNSAEDEDVYDDGVAY